MSGTKIAFAFVVIFCVPWLSALSAVDRSTGKASARQTQLTEDDMQIAVDCKSLRGSGTVYVAVHGDTYTAPFSCGTSM